MPFLGHEVLEILLSRGQVTKELAGWFSKGVVDEVERAVDALRSMIGGYRSPRAFEEDWKWLRLVVPLQLRLLVEQILWDKRGGWRDLVTGFGPVKGRGGRKPLSGAKAASAKSGTPGRKFHE